MNARIFVAALGVLTLAFIGDAGAQDQGDTQYVNPDDVTETDSHIDAEEGALTSPYDTNEGQSESSGWVFDGTTTTGTYQDTDTLEPSTGIVITPND